MEQPKLKDVIKVGRVGSRRVPYFPVVCACHQCGGYTGVHWEGKTQFPELAYEVALVQYGFSHLGKYDMGPPVKNICNCELELERLRKQMKLLPSIVNDTGWKGRSGGRCITDYTRSIEFEQPLTDEEVGVLRGFVSRDNCPGMTGVGCYVGQQPNIYIFNTTWDSSD